MTLPRELEAVFRSFKTTKGNNNTEKYFLWATMALFVLGGIGLITGTYRPDPSLWRFIMGVMAFLFGRVQGKERKQLDDE